jgi:hypothetical protein
MLSVDIIHLHERVAIGTLRVMLGEERAWEGLTLAKELQKT